MRPVPLKSGPILVSRRKFSLTPGHLPLWEPCAHGVLRENPFTQIIPMASTSHTVIWFLLLVLRVNTSTASFASSAEQRYYAWYQSSLVLGKCKALWGKPRTLLRLSQRSTELSCTRFDAERWKKSKAIDEQRCGTVFFCVNTSAHARVRLSYEFRLWLFVRYTRWRACQDSLSCWTRLALANEKEGERWKKVETTLQSFAASTELECERQE